LKKFIYPLLFIFPAFSVAQDSTLDAQSSFRQVITEEMIKDGGAFTLADIIALSDKWNLTTIDGVTAYLSSSYLSLNKNQNYTVLLDGQPLNLNIFDSYNLTMIPVALNQIDYVELINMPQIYFGNFTGRGLIHIHTKKAEKGFSVQGMHSVGNETGDPGPYKFTEYSSPNVDKINYILSLSIDAAGANWYLKGGTTYSDNFLTDPSIKFRIANLSTSFNKERYSTYYGKFGFNFLESKNEIFYGSSSGYDYFFFAPHGNEIPVNRIYRHAGLSGSINKRGNLSLRYSAVYSLNSLKEWENKKNIDFDFTTENYSATIEGKLTGSRFNLIAGLSYDYTKGKPFEPLINPDLIYKKIYGEFSYRLSDNFMQSLGIMALGSSEITLWKGFFANKWEVMRGHFIESNFAYFQNLFSEYDSYWNWYFRGYNFSEAQPRFYQFFGEINNGSTFTADVSYSFKSERFKAAIQGSWRSFINQNIEWQLYLYRIYESTFYSSPVNIFSEAGLDVSAFNIELEHHITSTLSHKIFYSFQKDLEGSSLFKELWKMYPAHTITYSVLFKPVPTFTLWGRLRYTSPSKWFSYKYVSSQSGGLYNKEIESGLLLDLSASKWFWNKRIWGSIIFRNIFNQNEKYHPIGARFDLRFYLQVHLYLNSIFI
jgi:hypothetical protein